MKFLFFDIECAYCYKNGRGVICEFGYVLTDELFNIIDRDTLLIAPKIEFHPYVIKNILAFTKDEYNSAPNFKKRYDKIRALLEDRDTVVIGHTTDTDANYINFATKRYRLPYINFAYYDIKEIHKRQTNAKEYVSLEKMIIELNLEFDGRLHKSEDDAYVTMLAFQALCRLAQTDALSFLSEYAQFKGYTFNGKIKEAKPTAAAAHPKKRRATGSA